MADSALTVTINSFPNGIDNTQRMQRVFGHFAIGSGNYPTDGLAISWEGQEPIKATATSSGGPKPAYPPIVFEDSPSASISGYLYQVGSDGNLHVLVSNSVAGDPNVELTAGDATPAAVVAASIAFVADFYRD